jgi:two-component system sensor histidine kinase KdpD
LPPVDIDPELMQMALRQLIENAVKYSPPGAPIKISAFEDQAQMIFAVQDNGPGVPDAERSLIFDRFYRSAGSRDTVPGAGLGLPIAKDIVRAHGGTIWVDGKQGEGAAFKIALPIKEPTHV